MNEFVKKRLEEYKTSKTFSFGSNLADNLSFAAQNPASKTPGTGLDLQLIGNHNGSQLQNPFKLNGDSHHLDMPLVNEFPGPKSPIFQRIHSAVAEDDQQENVKDIPLLRAYSENPTPVGGFTPSLSGHFRGFQPLNSRADLATPRSNHQSPMQKRDSFSQIDNPLTPREAAPQELFSIQKVFSEFLQSTNTKG